MLAIEPFREGREYRLHVGWVIDTLDSVDDLNGVCSDVEYCGFVDYESIPDEDDPDARGRWINGVYEVTGWERWNHLLYHKRHDEQYEYIVQSLTEFGMVRPATLSIEKDGSVRRFGDGHHRLAVHVDMGWETILVRATSSHLGGLIEQDSGAEAPDEWNLYVKGVHIHALMFPDSDRERDESGRPLGW